MTGVDRSLAIIALSHSISSSRPLAASAYVPGPARSPLDDALVTRSAGTLGLFAVCLLVDLRAFNNSHCIDTCEKEPRNHPHLNR